MNQQLRIDIILVMTLIYIMKCLFLSSNIKSKNTHTRWGYSWLYHISLLKHSGPEIVKRPDQKTRAIK